MVETILQKEEQKFHEYVAKFKEFLHEKYYQKLVSASNEDRPLVIDFRDLDRLLPEISDILANEPGIFFKVADESVMQTELPQKVPIRVSNLQDAVAIRDLRARHLNKFVCIEGIVRRTSEIRPEIMRTIWECSECGEKIVQERLGNIIFSPLQCACGNKRGFKQTEKIMVDTRWITIEEPFELTEGERPSQVNVVLRSDLVSTDGRAMTEPGNRLKITGVLKDITKGKTISAMLDFYLDANHVEPTEIGWEKIKMTKEDEEAIMQLANNENIYELLVDSLAPSLYGLREVKEAIIMQLFGGVPRTLKDKTKLRGEIHVLLIGDPASGKSQLLKLVPQIVPRGKYVSGKGVTAAGLTATVTKDELLGGWVLEAGAIVLANKGLLSIDEFEKMSNEDQVAMHEALEQGCYDYLTDIILEDGSRTSIGDFVESHIKGDKGDDIRKDISDRNIYLMSSDFKQIKPSKAIAVRKHLENEIHRISLPTGHSLKITPNHPIFIIRDGKITAIKASELIVGDYVPLPRRLSIHGKPQILPQLQIPIDNKHKKISFPKKSSKELCEWIGLVIAEGNAEINRKKKNGVCFSNQDRDIVDHYLHLTKSLFSINPYIQIRKKDSLFMVRAISRPLYKFVHSMGPAILEVPYRKSLPEWIFKASNEEISYILRGLFDGEGSVNNAFGTITFSTTSLSLAKQVQELLLRFEIFSGLYTDRNLNGKRAREAYKVQVSGKQNLLNFAEFIGFIGKRRHKLEKLLLKPTVSSVWNYIPNIIPTMEQIRKSLRLSYDNTAGHELTLARKRNNISKDMLIRIISNFEKRINFIEKSITQLEGNLTYSEFKELRERLGISRSEIAREIGVSEQNLWYHKSVKGNKTLLNKSIFATKNILLNMLEKKQEIEKLRFILNAPVEWIKIKSIELEKGKRWVYDVTMNPTGVFIGNGIICHNSVSIAKASIVATLPAQTAVLAGGNPKHSRFDTYIPIAKQITIPETLLSRFDLKFALKDVPDSETDKKVVDHIILSREADYEASKPKIDPEFIRKYVAYTKDHCKPTMTEEASKILKRFYLKTRKKAEVGGGAIPITLRQFEALMRISESSAKIQLSDKVRKSDAMRAIRLMTFSLRQLGFDPETGQIDIDRAEGGTSAKERSKIKVVIEIIEILSQKKKEMALYDIITLAKKEGVEDAEEIIERLKKEGMLFEPNPGFVQKV